MKNKEKLLKLNSDGLAFVLICPGEFDDEFKKDVFAQTCNKSNCSECIKEWLEKDYENGFEYLNSEVEK